MGTLFLDPILPTIVKRTLPNEFELLALFDKENMKKIRYLGSRFHRTCDRAWIYNAIGGVRKTTAFVIERYQPRQQYHHFNTYWNGYRIRSHNANKSYLNPVGDYYFDNAVDGRMHSTNIMYYEQSRNYRNVSKNAAIAEMEKWGVRYILKDEFNSWSLQHTQAQKHTLYAHKFYWTPTPETNREIGDVDFQWKGDEKINYSDYNAHSSCDANKFHSLWERTLMNSAANKSKAQKVEAA